MKTIFLLTTITAINSFATCPFDNLMVQDVLSSKKFKIEKESMIDLPQSFKNYQHKIGEFSSKECAQSIKSISVRHKKTKNTFQIYFTNEDHCDGGNAYGLIFNRSDLKNAVGVIIDSDISCL